MLTTISKTLTAASLCIAAGCVGLRDFIVDTSAPVTSRDYDALWDATRAALSRHGTIAREDKDKGYMATEPKNKQWRRHGRNSMPATVYSVERIEARLRKMSDGRHVVRVRVYEQQSMPHDFRLYRSDAKEAKPEGRVHLVSHDSASTRSPLLERQVLDDVAAELALRGGPGE